MSNTPPNDPSLQNPIDHSILVGSTLVFVFTIPTDIDNNKLVFNLELDTNSTIDFLSSNYKTIESRKSTTLDLKTNGKWEVQNSVGAYIPLVQAGIGSEYYGRTAKVTMRKSDTTQFPDIETIWYWRIGASDSIVSKPYFNQVVFLQGVFSS